MHQLFCQPLKLSDMKPWIDSVAPQGQRALQRLEMDRGPRFTRSSEREQPGTLVSSGLHRQPLWATWPLHLHQQALQLWSKTLAGVFPPSLTHQRPFLYPLYFQPSKWGPLKNSQLCASWDTNPNTSLFELQLCQLCAPRLPGQLWGLKTAPRPPSQEGQAAGLTLLPVSSSRLGWSCKQFLCAVPSLEIAVFVVTEVFKIFSFFCCVSGGPLFDWLMGLQVILDSVISILM